MLSAVFAVGALGLAQVDCVIEPYDLKANLLREPVVDGAVRLSWKLRYGVQVDPTKPVRQNKVQAGYRITAATSANPLMWDTGYVASGETLDIAYAGPVAASERVVWTVSVAEQAGSLCAGSASSSFEFGLVQPSDWAGAAWLAREPAPDPPASNCSLFADNPAPRFRREIELPASTSPVASGRLYISGLGYFRAWLDGAELGNGSIIDPPWTLYSARVNYKTVDVTAALQAADVPTHVLCVELGNGWWNPLPLEMWGHVNLRDALPTGVPMFVAVLKVFYADGTVKAFPTAPGDWLAGGSPTLRNSIYLGEVFDARLEDPAWLLPGWALPAAWKPPVTVSQGVGPLEAIPQEPVKEHEALEAVQIAALFSGSVLILDTSKNHAGQCAYAFAGSPGDVINFRYGELLLPNGSVNCNTSTVGQVKEPNPAMPCQPEFAWQRDQLILGNGSTTTWKPSYGWRGFRYIEVHLPTSPFYGAQPHRASSALVNATKLLSATCYTMRTNFDEIMPDFKCSDPRVLVLHRANKNSWQGNLMSVESDCPHREKFPYAPSEAEAGINLFDFSAFYRKRLVDFNDAQQPNGGFTETSPYVGIEDGGLGGKAGSIGWATFQPYMQMLLYKYYGVKSALALSYNHTLAYAALLDTNPPTIENGLGDWMPIEDTGTDLTGLAFQLIAYRIVANISSVLGDAPTAAGYAAKAAALVDKINGQFLDAASGSYTNLNKTGAAARGGAYYQSLAGCPLEGRDLRRCLRSPQLEAVPFNGTQAGQALALFLHVAPPAEREKVLAVLVGNINAASNITGPPPGYGQGPPRGGPGPHMLCGMFGVQWVLQALADNGQMSLAYEVNVQDSYPSFFWMTRNPYVNATTLWESWYYSDNVFSHNHPMFGTNEVWFKQNLLGISPAPDANGFDKLLIVPRPPLAMLAAAPGRNASASGTFQTARGPVRVAWTVAPSPPADVVFSIEFSTPPNTQASVHLPGGTSFTAGSGSYTFVETFPQSLLS